MLLPGVQLKSYDPFLAPRRWLLRLGARFYYPIAVVAVMLIIGVMVRDALSGPERVWVRRLIDLALIGGLCVFTLFWRAERLWLRGKITWLVRFTRPDLAFLYASLAVIFITLGMISLILIAPTSTVANYLWPLYLFPLLFLAERADTGPFLFVLVSATVLLTAFRIQVGATLSGVLAPPLWLVTLATSNYYLARRHMLLELRTMLLRQVANQLSNTPNMETSFQAIVELIGTRLRHDHLRLWVLDPSGGWLNVRAAWGTPKENWGNLSLPLFGGIPGSVLRKGAVETWGNVAECTHYESQPPYEWIRSVLAVPIMVGGQAVGVLEAMSRNTAEFWEMDEEQLTLMADSIGIALARSQHVRRESERLRDTLWRAVSELGECTTIQEMFDTIAREARENFGADLVVLYQLAPGTGYPLTPPLSTGAFQDPTSLHQSALPVDSVVFDLLERWEPYYSLDAQNDPILGRGGRPLDGSTLVSPSRKKFIHRENVSSIAVLPLGSRGEKVGALFLHYRDRRDFSPLDKLTLEAFASLVAEQINRERAHWRKYEAFGGVMFGVHGPLTLSADSLRRLTASARAVLRSDPTTAEAALDQAQNVARKLEMAAMLTRLARRDELEATGLRDELRRAATKLLQFVVEPNCRVLTRIPPEVDDLPIAVLDALYCVAMEAVANAAFHGHAKRIDINIDLEPTAIRLEIADNGIGFEVGQVRHGPNGIFETLELVRTQFAAQGTVDSAPGKGTRITVVFPCLAGLIETTDVGEVEEHE